MSGSVTIPVTLFLAGAYSLGSKQFPFMNSTVHHRNAIPVRQTHIKTNFPSY